MSADGQFATSKTVYRYTSGLPSRRFAVGLAAQGLSRRHLEHLLDSTIDLDIANCLFALVTQLIDMLKPTKTGYAYIDGLLDFPSFRAAAKDRDTALAHIASVVGKAAAKQINLQVAGGVQSQLSFEKIRICSPYQRKPSCCDGWPALYFLMAPTSESGKSTLRSGRMHICSTCSGQASKTRCSQRSRRS